MQHEATLQALAPSPFDPQGQTRQLARVNYARPDTWSFFFGMTVLNPPNDPVNAVNVLLRVDFELMIGIGRSVMQLQNGQTTGQGFCRLELAYTTPLVQVPPFSTWTSIARTPALDQAGAVQQDLQHFCAQDINCTARIFGTSGAILLGSTYNVEVFSFFAPRTHIRPEWFDDEDMFRGGEIGGT